MTLKDARHAYAEELRVVARLTDDRVVDAFVAVPRERFVGPGPWRILNQYEMGYWTTEDAGRTALQSLGRDPHERDETCWLHSNGWCLSKRELH